MSIGVEPLAEHLGSFVDRIGTRGSGPAIAESNSATSPTVRPIGPSTERSCDGSSDGHDGTRPGVGRNPTMLQKDAGFRSEPTEVAAVREGDHPRGERGGRPARRATHRASEVEGVARRTEDRIEGLRAGSPFRRVRLADHHGARGADPLDEQLVLVGHVFGEDRRTDVVRTPAVSARSLCAIGRPCSGPRSSPRRTRRAAPRAASAARSGVGVTIALTLPLTASIRARCASSSSTSRDLTCAEQRREVGCPLSPERLRHARMLGETSGGRATPAPPGNLCRSLGPA